MEEFSVEVPPPSRISSGARLTQGIDILGVRLPVQDVGGELLDGITTVTQTVRYLGLRAWVARRYALARLSNAWGPYSEFAGRVEAGVAIGNLLVDSGTPGLIGSDRALPVAQTAAETFDLQKLVSQTAAAVYAGASDQLLLTASSGGDVPELSTERGLRLQMAIETTLGATRFGRDLARDPKASRFSRDALAEVGAIYSMRGVDGEEREAILAALLPVEPFPREVPRMGSYALILELAEQLGRVPTTSDIFAAAVAPHVPLPTFYGPWRDGWARYLVRDMLAVVHEAVLAAITRELEARARSGALDGATVVESLLQRVDEFDEPLATLGLLPNGAPAHMLSVVDLATALSKVQGDTIPGPVRRWSGTIDEQGVIRCALSAGAGALALAPVAWLLAQTRIEQPTGTGLGVRGMSRQGQYRLGLAQVVLPGAKALLDRRATLHEAASELAWRTVQQHLLVAWTRLAADPRLEVSCIATDGARWSLRRPFKQGRTAARLTRAIVPLPRQPRPHAKFLFLDGPDGSAAVVGSANCSAAAWLVPVNAGGNTEAVVVYDQIDETHCSEALESFAVAAVPPSGADLRGPTPKEDVQPSSQELTLHELASGALSGRVRVRLSHRVEDSLSVELDFDGLRTPLEASDDRRLSWSGPAPDLPDTVGTRFGSVVIQTSHRVVRSALRWLDEEDVLHNWRTRRGASAIIDLGRPQGRRSQYSRIREEVSEVASAIFADPGSFPDPGPTRRPPEQQDKVAPTDPDALLRSISDIASDLKPPGVSGGSFGFGLSGVLRVLFPEPEQLAAPESEDELGDEGAIPPPPPPPPPQPLREPPPIDERVKLVAEMEDFFGRLAVPRFADSCTSRQLVQAIAFPLAVAAKGLDGGWIDAATAGEWTLRAADHLLQISPGGSASQGLLRRVANRYATEGRADTFERVVGDGMLWAALSGALMRTAEGSEPNLQRALSLRDVFEARLLVAKANPTRLAQLLTTAGDGRHLALLEQSQRAALAVRELEAALLAGSAALLGEQSGRTVQLGDPIWKLEIGFGQALESARIKHGAKMVASLRRRPGTSKVLVDRFVDLRIAAELAPEIARLVREVEACST